MPAKIYPWETWFKRRLFTLRKGDDYDCSTLSMAQQVRSRATERKLYVTVLESQDGLIVEITHRNGKKKRSNHK